MSQYNELKDFLLTEYKLTPREYKIRFETAVKMRRTLCLRLSYVICLPDICSAAAVVLYYAF